MLRYKSIKKFRLNSILAFIEKKGSRPVSRVLCPNGVSIIYLSMPKHAFSDLPPGI